MRTLLLPLLIWLVLVTSGCNTAMVTASNATAMANRNAAASGNPFRWKTKEAQGGATMYLVLADIPSGPSAADEVLTRDTLAAIAAKEAAEGRAWLGLDAVKPLPNGQELWVLKTEGTEGVAYYVSFAPSPQGGVDIGLSPPRTYVKE